MKLDQSQHRLILIDNQPNWIFTAIQVVNWIDYEAVGLSAEIYTWINDDIPKWLELELGFDRTWLNNGPIELTCDVDSNSGPVKSDVTNNRNWNAMASNWTKLCKLKLTAEAASRNSFVNNIYIS